MKFGIIFIGIFALCLANPQDEESWNKHKARLGKGLYNPNKEALYKSNYLAATRRIEENHALYRNNQVDYVMGLNQYSHLPHDEFLRLRTGLIPSPPPENETSYVPKKARKEALPDAIDYQQKQWTTSVKDQGDCASCYSFAVTAAVEGQAIKQYGIATELSNQQIIDCSRSYGNLGCYGGYTGFSMRYVIDDGGLTSYQTYPYKEMVEQCTLTTAIVDPVRSYRRRVHISKEELKEHLVNVGPLVVSLDVKPDLNNYQSGLYHDPTCGPKTEIKELNHACLLVGYGEMDGKPYWKVKNSWGPNWGVDGYFYISHEFDCGITTDVVVPNI